MFRVAVIFCCWIIVMLRNNGVQDLLFIHVRQCVVFAHFFGGFLRFHWRRVVHKLWWWFLGCRRCRHLAVTWVNILAWICPATMKTQYMNVYSAAIPYSSGCWRPYRRNAILKYVNPLTDIHDITRLGNIETLFPFTWLKKRKNQKLKAYDFILMIIDSYENE